LWKQEVKLWRSPARSYLRKDQQNWLIDAYSNELNTCKKRIASYSKQMPISFIDRGLEGILNSRQF
jgi:hypothetical protein